MDAAKTLESRIELDFTRGTVTFLELILEVTLIVTTKGPLLLLTSSLTLLFNKECYAALYPKAIRD